jgi:acetyl esterase/lipase
MWPIALLVLGAGVFLAAMLDRAVVYKHIERSNPQPPGTGPLDAQTYTREVLRFPCSGVSCEAWLYMPKQQPPATPPPVVLMAHGMGGQKDMGLHKFATAFVEAGMAAFVFDYRWVASDLA